MAEVIFDPTPEIVNEVNKLVTPRLTSSGQLETLANRFQTSYSELEEVVIAKSNFLEDPKAKLAEAEERTVSLKGKLEQTRLELSTSQTDLNLVKYRFAEKERKANFRLDLWIRVLGVITRVPDDPLNHLTEDLSKAQQERIKAEEILGDTEKRAEREFSASINRLRMSLGQSRNRLVALWEPNLIDDRDLSSKYIRLYIPRAEEYILLWARKHAFEEEFKDQREIFEADLIRRYPIEAEKASFRDHNWIDQFAKDIYAEWVKSV